MPHFHHDTLADNTISASSNEFLGTELFVQGGGTNSSNSMHHAELFASDLF